MDKNALIEKINKDADENLMKEISNIPLKDSGHNFLYYLKFEIPIEATVETNIVDGKATMLSVYARDIIPLIRMAIFEERKEKNRASYQERFVEKVNRLADELEEIKNMGGTQ